MESYFKDSKEVSKTQSTAKYSLATHFIIEKNFFNCIICYDISPNIYETSCCGVLVCHVCKSYLEASYCPVCKLKTDFKISKIARRIISNSITECPLCDFNDKYDRIASHFFSSHKEYILTCDKLEKDQKIFNFLSVFFCISLEKKLFMHDHALSLVTREKDCVCYAGSVLRFKNCKMPDTLLEGGHNQKDSNIDKEQSISPINQNPLDDIIQDFSIVNLPSNDNNNINSNENFSAQPSEDLVINPSSSFVKKLSDSEELKNLIMQRLIYFCKECEGYFCESCLEAKDIWIPVKVHEHPLKLVNRNNGWFCDGRNCPDGCFNVNNNTEGLARYRCNGCDFDLCEKCLIYYMQ